jgi:hypothetical protein
MNRGRAALVAAALVLVAGCAGSSPPADAGGRTPVADQGCPPVHGQGFAAIDYVDFIHAFDRQYLVQYSRHSALVHRSDLDRIVLRSRCSYSALNDRTHRTPQEPPRNGDTAFLPPGTPIHAVNGWPARCRLAARSGGELRVYFAQQRGTKRAEPRACALHH